jgi:hypothetical protein
LPNNPLKTSTSWAEAGVFGQIEKSVNFFIAAGFYDEFAAIYFMAARGAGYRAVVESQSRKEDTQTAPQGFAGGRRKTEVL